MSILTIYFPKGDQMLNVENNTLAQLRDISKRVPCQLRGKIACSDF